MNVIMQAINYLQSKTETGSRELHETAFKGHLILTLKYNTPKMQTCKYFVHQVIPPHNPRKILTFSMYTVWLMYFDSRGMKAPRCSFQPAASRACIFNHVISFIQHLIHQRILDSRASQRCRGVLSHLWKNTCEYHRRNP